MSCCMRDAVELEARNIPTVILVNDVFEPIAHATAALLALPSDYVTRNIVWLPHPTSNLERSAAAALVDERIDAIRAAFLGRERRETVAESDAVREDDLSVARQGVDGLARSLRADGADLVLHGFEDGILVGELRLDDVACDDGACIMPAEQLAKMIEASLRPKIAALRGVMVREIRPT